MAKRKLSLSRMKAISEAYERMQALQYEINSIQELAERLSDTSSSVVLSLDLTDDLIKDLHMQTWTTTTSTGSYFNSSNQADVDNSFILSIPDTVTLEVLGVILRHKQQLLENENNNI